MEGGAQNTPPGVGIVDEKASGQGEAGYVLGTERKSCSG